MKCKKTCFTQFRSDSFICQITAPTLFKTFKKQSRQTELTCMTQCAGTKNIMTETNFILKDSHQTITYLHDFCPGGNSGYFRTGVCHYKISTSTLSGIFDEKVGPFSEFLCLMEVSKVRF